MLQQAKLQSIILTTNMTASEAYYRDLLGLKPVGRFDGALVFKVGGGDLRICPVPSHEATEHTVLGFAVNNVAAEVDAQHRKGITFERLVGTPCENTGIFTTPDGSKVAWFRDSEGNLLSVVEYKPPQ